MQSRRNFIGHASAAVAISGAQRFWSGAAHAAERGPDKPILVVVELNGGNDGLNTVVPFADDIYHKSRPTLRIEPEKVLKLDDHMGLNPTMKPLHGLWNEGCLTVIQGVGYPNPNRSHFRSMEIWQTAETGSSTTTGWLGRTADADHAMQSCHVGDEAVPVALQGRKAFAQSLVSIDAFRLPGDSQLSKDLSNQANGSLLAEIGSQFGSTAELARRLGNSKSSGGSTIDPKSLKGRFETILRLIESDSPYRVYYTSQDGYDTHAGQQYQHQSLLNEFSSELAQFLKRLKESRLDDKVLVLAFSEFGRRLKENANAGTDHGTAAPVFIAGNVTGTRLLGKAPDLKNLDETGDPHHTTDFRDVYAAVLRDWLKVDPAPILGSRAGDLKLDFS